MDNSCSSTTLQRSRPDRAALLAHWLLLVPLLLVSTLARAQDVDAGAAPPAAAETTAHDLDAGPAPDAEQTSDAAPTPTLDAGQVADAAPAPAPQQTSAAAPPAPAAELEAEAAQLEP